MLLDRKQLAVAGDDELGSPFDGGGDVLLVIGVIAYAGESDLATYEIGVNDDIVKP